MIEDRRVAGDVPANDADPDGDPLTVTAVNGADPGVGAAVQGRWRSLTLNVDGSFDYRADRAEALIAGQTRKDAFEYSASDGTEATAAAPSITVRGDDEALFDKGARDALRGRGDVLVRHSGRDALLGQRGGDVLRGGSGNDRLFGGGGSASPFGQRQGPAEGRRRARRLPFRTPRRRRGPGRPPGQGPHRAGCETVRAKDIHQKGKHAVVDYGKRGDLIKLLRTEADDLDRGISRFETGFGAGTGQRRPRRRPPPSDGLS